MTQRHKVFISFYHHDDQIYKDLIDRYLSSNIINKSVRSGEYDSENSDEYIKRLIREDKISDSSVVIVLIGPNTFRRKHVDWEIYAALRPSINGSSGLIGITLPEYEAFNHSSPIPARFWDNLATGYAKLYTWREAWANFDKIIEEAYQRRITHKNCINNSRLQMQRNL